MKNSQILAKICYDINQKFRLKQKNQGVEIDPNYYESINPYTETIFIF